MSEQVEHILSRLLLPDTEAIQQATADLKKIIKDPSLVSALCTVLQTSQTAQVRQYAAVILRRRILRTGQWRTVPPDVTDSIKKNILQLLLQEPEKTVQKAIVQLIATVAKHSLPGGKWLDLFVFIQQYTHSTNAQEREMGMWLLSTVSSAAARQLKPHYGSLLELCAGSLDDQNAMVRFYAVQTLKHMIPLVGSDELKPFQQLVPKLLHVVSQMKTLDAEKATEAMEIFDELVESEVAIILPHLKTMIEFFLQTGADKTLDDSVRIKALSLISWLTRLKRKTILKLKLTIPILQVIFSMLCEEGGQDEFDEDENESVHTVAGQVIDIMAQYLPPDKFLTPLMEMVEPALQNNNECVRRAAYLAIALSAEGCADRIRNTMLQPVLQCVYRGLADSSPLVQGSALFAMGQFSEHLQPDISKYSSELLPVLFEQLAKASQNEGKNPKGLAKAYYALEMFCENLGKDILPYLPQLMQYLLNVLRSAASVHIKELSISSIAAVANAAGQDLVPYFPELMEQLKVYLATSEDESRFQLQVQAIDTLGVLARTLGADHFSPLASECLQLGMTLMTKAEDPDLKRCIYGLFAAISTIMKNDMGQFLEPMVRQMIDSLKSDEGITVQFASEGNELFKIFDSVEEEIGEDEDDLDDDDEEEEDEVKGLSVENAYVEEKEDACYSLGELAMNTGVAFLPYLEESYKEVAEMLAYPATDVKKHAVTALGQFCCTIAQAAEETQSQETRTAMDSMLGVMVPKFLQMIREDTDREVVMATLEALNQMITKIKAPMIKDKAVLDGILSASKEIFQEKTACQDHEEECPELADQQAEYDNMLMENAGEIIPSVARVVGGQTIEPYLVVLIPELMKKLKKSASVAEKSFAVGTLAEIIDAVGDTAAVFVEPMYPVFMAMLHEQDDEVRSNAVYAAGVLAANGGNAMYSKFPEILKELSVLLSKEGQDRRVIDNICAAVCRMIHTDNLQIPLSQTLPGVIQCLPLKEDLEENVTVYSCLSKLYESKPEEMLPYLPQLLSVYSQVLPDKSTQPVVKELLVEMVKDTARRYPQVLQTALDNMDPSAAKSLQEALSACNGCG